MAANILRLAETAASWPGMGRAGRRHVEDRHDARKEILGLEAIYREVSGS
jgi:hypothetical protein